MKRYLKTPEEVVQALKDGKVVESEGYSYKLVNGVICSFYKQGYYKWNVGGAIFQSDEPYVDEPEQLKLEVGKFYKTRNGKKAFVYGKYKNTNEIYPYAVVTVTDPISESTVTENGKRCIGQETCSDLVAPWEE